MINYQPIEVPGDHDLLKQLFLNLLDNAVTYTPPGGQVTIDLFPYCSDPPEFLDERKIAGWVMVTLRDTGPGVKADDLPHLFERHYRDSNRTAQGKQGSGLGLSIALLLAQAHGGTITAANNALGGGACFTVWLPMAKMTATVDDNSTDWACSFQ